MFATMSFSSQYKKYFIIALVLVMLIPCTLKRELKQVVLSETQQQSNPGENKISCATFYELNSRVINVKDNKQILRSIYFYSLQKKYSSNNSKINLPDFFCYQKEKIPTYLLIERFLI